VVEHGKLPLNLKDLGAQAVKNIAEPIHWGVSRAEATTITSSAQSSSLAILGWLSAW
jgi:hypothetical protein